MPTVPDGQLSFEGGQDASMPPSRLPQNKYAGGVNVSTSKGVISPRYGYERKTLTFPSGGYSYRFNKVANFKVLFETGKFQCMLPYEIGGKAHLIVVISGVIFLINIDTYVASVLTLNSETQLNESAPRINGTVAGRFAVLFDFPARPIIIEGHVASRSNVDFDEVPVSNMGTYNQSRLFFSNFGNEFSAGDPVGNTFTPYAPVTITEIVLEGSPFFGDVYQMPSRNNNAITAMATLQRSDESTGIGQLITATKEEIWAYNTDVGRDEWLAGKFGIQISDKAGIAGNRAYTNVNSDIFFVSGDGQLRTLSAAQNEQKTWARVPISSEVDNWISYISDELIPYSTLTYFNNKIFWTVRPYRIPARRLDGSPILDVAHSGVVVLDTANVSRMGSEAAPAWDGLWVGVRPMDMCVVQEHMFIMSKEYYSRNALYEVDPELKFDRTHEGKRRQIQGTLYTREHFFNDLFDTKKLVTIELGISDIKGQFEVGIDWKPSHSSNFSFWSSFKHHIPVEYRTITGGDIPQRQELAFRELKFGMPENVGGHPVTKDLFDHVKRVQLRIIIKGDNWQLNEYQIVSESQIETDTEFLREDELPVETEMTEPYSDWTYEEFGL